MRHVALVTVMLVILTAVGLSMASLRAEAVVASAGGPSSDNANWRARVAALEAEVARLDACNEDMTRQQAATIEKLLVTMGIVEDQAVLIDQLCLCAEAGCCAPKRPDPPDPGEG